MRTKANDPLVPLQVSVPTSVFLRVNWFVDQLQYEQPTVSRAHVVSRLLTEKLNELRVPLLTAE